MARIIRLPSPPREYVTEWANQYTRAVEFEYQSLWAALSDIETAETELDVGTTVINGGVSGRILYDNAGILGEKAVTGTGDVVLATSPTLVTPALGAATATSLAVGGAALGGNALAVTGTVDFNSAVTMDAALTYGTVTLANSVTGTGSMVLSASPVFTGLATGPGTLSNLVIRTQDFTANDTYTPHANMVYAQIEGVGGGGGGGGTANSGATTAGAGGGGGSGGYSRVVVSRAAVLPNQAVTIGAAGTAGASGNNAGGAGGTTSVGTLLIANGGSGGAGAASGASGAPGAGADLTGVAGDVTIPGSGGGRGVNSGNTATASVSKGFGGASYYGGAPIMSGGQSNGVAASANSGSGGSGGSSSGAAGAVTGGAGGAGYVIITEYCTA